MSGVIRGLQQVKARRERAAGSKSGKNADFLNKLTSRYTMHQERSIHQAAVNRVNGSISMAEEKGFADNVELF